MTAARASVVAVVALAACLIPPTVRAATPRTRPAPVPIQTSHGRFAWDDAAIGAAAALGLVLVAAGVHFLKGDRAAS
jgi:hypothetical protein